MVFEEPPGEDTVKAHIKRLRQKLKVVGAPDDFIETVYGWVTASKPSSKPMFQSLRLRLLLSYLTVMAAILGYLVQQRMFFYP